MKKKFILLFAILMSIAALSDERVLIGELYYYVDEDYKTASVVGTTIPTMTKTQYSSSVTIPSTISYQGYTYEVVEIGWSAFQYCNIYFVRIPNSVKKIGEYAFDGCRALETVILPKKLRKIEKETFGSCLKLKNIELGDNIQYIGENAFEHCWALETLTIPSGVQKIGYNAFYEVNNVIYNGNAEGAPWGAKNINVASDGYLTFADKNKTVLESCSRHASGRITIPNGVTKILANAFEKCTEIKSITIPSTLKYIEYGAFLGCKNLESLTIPKSVETIEVEAFKGCKALRLRIPEKFRGELGNVDCAEVIYY